MMDFKMAGLPEHLAPAYPFAKGRDS